MAIVATLCASGCFNFSLGYSSSTPEPEVLWIAVGAEVELRLSDCSSGGDRRLVHCVPSSIGKLKSVDVGEAFEILASKSAGGEAQVLLRAKQEGRTSLKYSYQDVAGREQRGELLLQAAHPQRVGVYVDCDGQSQSAESILIGAGSVFEVFVNAFAEHGGQLETGALALIDFGSSFERLEQTGSDVRLRAPLGSGNHLWLSAFQEPVEVRVIDQFAVEFQSFPPAADQPARLRLTPHVEPPGTTVCTAPSNAAVYVHVDRGDCQLAVNGVRFAGVLPLAPPTSGFWLQVLGAGECVVSAQPSGLEPITTTLSLPMWSEVLPEGPIITASPLPFALHDALPDTACYAGPLDGSARLPSPRRSTPIAAPTRAFRSG